MEQATLMRERAIEIIGRMPDERMGQVVDILQVLEVTQKKRCDNRSRAQSALQRILSFPRRLPEDFDVDRALREARDEKFGRPDRYERYH